MRAVGRGLEIEGVGVAAEGELETNSSGGKRERGRGAGLDFLAVVWWRATLECGDLRA